MSDQILLLAARLTVLFPEPVGPMTLGDIKLDNSLLRSLSRTLSRYHLFQSPLCSPLQGIEVFWLLERILEFSESLLRPL